MTSTTPRLTTTYLGLELATPLVASAGPLSQTPEGVAELAEAGAGAVVMYSLFEEQLRHEAERQAALAEQMAESYAESLSFFPAVPVGDSGLSWKYLSTLERSVAAAGVPVIASLNGSTLGSWVDFAERMEGAGAAAIELNMYGVPGDAGSSSVGLEDRHVAILDAVRARVRVPIAVKLSPFLAGVGGLVARLETAGADGVVLFNRLLVPDIDPATMSMVSRLELSTSAEGAVPRAWIAALRSGTRLSLAGSGGVETADDVVRYLLAGADAVMTTSALVRHGGGYARELLTGLTDWLTARGITDVADVRGTLAVPPGTDIGAWSRAGYVSALEQAKALSRR